MIDRRQMEDLPPTICEGSTMRLDIPLVVYNQIGPFLTEGTPEYSRRLSGIGSPLHKLTRIPGLKGNTQVRCSLCCENCESEKRDCKVEEYRIARANGNDSRVTRIPSRMGRKTSKMCPVCKIVLCKHCENLFHSEQVPVSTCRLADLPSTTPRMLTRGQQGSSSTSSNSEVVEPEPTIEIRQSTVIVIRRSAVTPRDENVAGTSTTKKKSKKKKKDKKKKKSKKKKAKSYKSKKKKLSKRKKKRYEIDVPWFI